MYRFVITNQGQNLIAKLLASENLKITRVMVGSGTLSPNADHRALTDLIQPFAKATSTEPVVRNNQVDFIVEYRNDMNDGQTVDFTLNEFGVFANDPDVGEILLYHADLGDNPQNIPAFGDGFFQVKQFAVSIALSHELNVTLDFPSLALLTLDDLRDHNLDPFANPAAINRHNIDYYAHDGRFIDIDDKFAGHIGHGGTEQHPLATGLVPGFSEINYNASEQARLDEQIETNRILALMRPRSENSNIMIRSGTHTLSGGVGHAQVTFPQPFPTVPQVVLQHVANLTTPLFPVNITVNGFVVQGLNTGQSAFWTAIADNSPPLIQP